MITQFLFIILHSVEKKKLIFFDGKYRFKPTNISNRHFAIKIEPPKVDTQSPTHLKQPRWTIPRRLLKN
jgi:hypothetical protein